MGMTKEGIDRAIRGIQAIADATERYCGFTGHEIRTNKSAVQMMLWLETKTGEKLVPKSELPRLYLRRWQPGKLPWTVEFSGARLSRSVSLLQLGLSPPRIFILLIHISLLHHGGPCAIYTIRYPSGVIRKVMGFMFR